ncbi:MAG: hypothetical protein QXS41_01025 [Candidatus Woesearchaeota archaeon]
MMLNRVVKYAAGFIFVIFGFFILSLEKYYDFYALNTGAFISTSKNLSLYSTLLSIFFLTVGIFIWINQLLNESLEKKLEKYGIQREKVKEIINNYIKYSLYHNSENLTKSEILGVLLEENSKKYIDNLKKEEDKLLAYNLLKFHKIKELYNDILENKLMKSIKKDFDTKESDSKIYEQIQNLKKEGLIQDYEISELLDVENYQNSAFKPIYQLSLREVAMRNLLKYVTLKNRIYENINNSNLPTERKNRALSILNPIFQKMDSYLFDNENINNIDNLKLPQQLQQLKDIVKNMKEFFEKRNLKLRESYELAQSSTTDKIENYYFNTYVDLLEKENKIKLNLEEKVNSENSKQYTNNFKEEHYQESFNKEDPFGRLKEYISKLPSSIYFEGRYYDDNILKESIKKAIITGNPYYITIPKIREDVRQIIIDLRAKNLSKKDYKKIFEKYEI